MYKVSPSRLRRGVRLEGVGPLHLREGQSVLRSQQEKSRKKGGTASSPTEEDSSFKSD